MITNTQQYDPGLARLVSSDTLVPCQQTTQPGFKTATNFSQQVMLKHPFLSDFHCLAEHLHAGLCEGDPEVVAYVPQPFQLRIRGQYYKPDCYKAMKSGQRLVLELKPRGEFSDDKRIPLEHFSLKYNMEFRVVSNESIFERRIEAENWLRITQVLNIAKTYDTTNEEGTLLKRFYQQPQCTLGSVVDTGDRERTYREEIALFRLLHRGQIQASLCQQVLDYDTVFSPCF